MRIFMPLNKEKGKGGQSPVLKVISRQILNLLLYLSFCTLTGTGLLLAFRLPPGYKGGHGLRALGWNRHDFADLHTWAALLFVTLITLHMAINWAWLVKCAASGRLWRLFLGLGIGIALIAVVFALPIVRGQ